MDNKKVVLVVELDQNELVVRLMEAIMGIKRPAGTSAKEVLARTDTDMVDAFARGAMTAMLYFKEQSAAGHKVQ